MTMIMFVDTFQIAQAQRGEIPQDAAKPIIMADLDAGTFEKTAHVDIQEFAEIKFDMTGGSHGLATVWVEGEPSSFGYDGETIDWKDGRSDYVLPPETAEPEAEPYVPTPYEIKPFTGKEPEIIEMNGTEVALLPGMSVVYLNDEPQFAVHEQDVPLWEGQAV